MLAAGCVRPACVAAFRSEAGGHPCTPRLSTLGQVLSSLHGSNLWVVPCLCPLVWQQTPPMEQGESACAPFNCLIKGLMAAVAAAPTQDPEYSTSATHRASLPPVRPAMRTRMGDAGVNAWVMVGRI